MTEDLYEDTLIEKKVTILLNHSNSALSGSKIKMGQPLQFLVLHCLATPEGRDVTKSDLTKWHLGEPPVGRGWKQYGYRAFIHLNGDIEYLIDNNDDDTVDPWEISNGVAGINSISNHISYAGGLAKDGKTPKDTRTPSQYASMAGFVLDFVKKHPQVKVAGHYHFANKACPSFDVEKFCEEIGVPEKNIYRKK